MPNPKPGVLQTSTVPATHTKEGEPARWCSTSLNWNHTPVHSPNGSRSLSKTKASAELPQSSPADTPQKMSWSAGILHFRTCNQHPKASRNRKGSDLWFSPLLTDLPATPNVQTYAERERATGLRQHRSPLFANGFQSEGGLWPFPVDYSEVK